MKPRSLRWFGAILLGSVLGCGAPQSSSTTSNQPAPKTSAVPSDNEPAKTQTPKKPKLTMDQPEIIEP